VDVPSGHHHPGQPKAVLDVARLPAILRRQDIQNLLDAGRDQATAHTELVGKDLQAVGVEMLGVAPAAGQVVEQRPEAVDIGVKAGALRYLRLEIVVRMAGETALELQREGASALVNLRLQDAVVALVAVFAAPVEGQLRALLALLCILVTRWLDVEPR